MWCHSEPEVPQDLNDGLILYTCGGPDEEDDAEDEDEEDEEDEEDDDTTSVQEFDENMDDAVYGDE